jgi:hypothetical protein
VGGVARLGSRIGSAAALCESGSCFPLWLRLLVDSFGTRLRVLGDSGSGRWVTVAGCSAGWTLLGCAPWWAQAEEADTVLVELGLVEQRYRAVLEVLDDGATVVEVARRYGLPGRPCTPGCAGRWLEVWVGWPTRAPGRPGVRTRSHHRSRRGWWRCGGRIRAGGRAASLGHYNRQRPHRGLALAVPDARDQDRGARCLFGSEISGAATCSAASCTSITPSQHEGSWFPRPTRRGPKHRHRQAVSAAREN